MKKIVLLALFCAACTTDPTTGKKTLDPNFVNNAQVAARNFCNILPSAAQITQLIDTTGKFVSTIQVGQAACALLAPVVGVDEVK